jgi:phage tail-like protein
MPENDLFPAHVFRFRVEFTEDRFTSGAGSASEGADVALCAGAFSEVTGLEATMEPKAIKEGGKNYSVNQRAGPVTFATVVLKRGMTSTRDLWNWFDLVAGGKYAYRLAATITMLDAGGQRVLAWRLEKAMPVKFKAADLNAKGTEVGIEELHLVHEGLRLVRRAGKDSGA